jgi:hypothetical protein
MTVVVAPHEVDLERVSFKVSMSAVRQYGDGLSKARNQKMRRQSYPKLRSAEQPPAPKVIGLCDKIEPLPEISIFRKILGMNPRLSRFRRIPVRGSLSVTERDHELFRHLHRHRFLRSGHMVSLLGGGPQGPLRRLQILFHYGYLERPRAQLQYYERGGSRQIAYGLGNKGGALLRRMGVKIPHVSWGEKNRAVGRIFLEHALLMSDVMVALELACRKRGSIRILYEDDLPVSMKRRPFQWRVRIDGGQKLGVVPDRMFALEMIKPDGAKELRHYFLEADRGTMPVIRKSLARTSMLRKLLAYEATWSQKLHRTRFGFDRIRVLTVTSVPGRVESLVKACAQLKHGRGLFLFASKSILEGPGDILDNLWQTARPGETSTLLG